MDFIELANQNGGLLGTISMIVVLVTQVILPLIKASNEKKESEAVVVDKFAGAASTMAETATASYSQIMLEVKDLRGKIEALSAKVIEQEALIKTLEIENNSLKRKIKELTDKNRKLFNILTENIKMRQEASIQEDCSVCHDVDDDLMRKIAILKVTPSEECDNDKRQAENNNE